VLPKIEKAKPVIKVIERYADPPPLREFDAFEVMWAFGESYESVLRSIPRSGDDVADVFIGNVRMIHFDCGPDEDPGWFLATDRSEEFFCIESNCGVEMESVIVAFGVAV